MLMSTFSGITSQLHRDVDVEFLVLGCIAHYFALLNLPWQHESAFQASLRVDEIIITRPLGTTHFLSGAL